MSTVTPTAASSSGGIQYLSEQNRSPSNQMGKDEFLLLLVTQLRYQDPTNPSTDTEFIAQLAQFTSLEQMTNMSNSMAATQANSMVGKYVYGQAENEYGVKEEFFGKVDSVLTKSGIHYAVIGDKMYNVAKITEVIDNGLMDGDNSLLQHASLIGKKVDAYFQEGSSDPVLMKDKEVKRILTKSGQNYIVVDNPVLKEDGTPEQNEDGTPKMEELEIPMANITQVK